MHRVPPTRMQASIAFVLLALVAAALAPSVARAADCPAILPVADVGVGMTGTGWTVAKGRTQVPFDVEILGVAHDGIAAGRDLIIVELSSPELDAAGGIWAGMSGSPVYVGGELLGAVSYGFSFGPSKIGGVTPAEDMVNLLGLPAPATALARVPDPRTVRLGRSLARTVAREAGTSVQQASTLRQLQVPLAMSGLGPQAMKVLLANFKNRRSDAFIPYAGASVPRQAAIAPTLADGDNFASALSYGDVTAAAVGTATYVCDGQALAFGHPFLFGGPTALGANAADAFAIVPDPVYGPFKFAGIAEPLGVVDQDRLAGLRVSLGGVPPAIPIETVVNVPELGVHREGLTEVVANDLSGYLTFASLLSSIDSAFDASGSGSDAAGRGTASIWWTFEGTRADGTPWSISRGNRYVSKAQISAPAALFPGITLDSIIWNPGERVTVTRAKVAVTIEKAVRLYTIKNVLVARGNGRFHARSAVHARPGMKLRVRVVLRKFEGGTKTVNYSYRVPKRLPPRSAIVFYGSAPFFEEDCFSGFCFVGEEFYEPAETVDDALEMFRDVRRNDQLRGAMILGRRFGGARSTRLDGVVVGLKGVVLLTNGSPGGDIDFFRRVFRHR